MRNATVQVGPADVAARRQSEPVEAGLEHGLQGDALRRSGTSAGSSAASSFRRSCTSRSSTAATCAARAAGSMWPPSRRPSSPTAFHKLVREAKAMGNVFFGIVGGEPFMHPQLLDMLAEHPDCYFQIFTNGHFITDETAQAAAAARQRHAAHQRRGQRDRQRRAPRPRRRAQQDDAGLAELPRSNKRLHRRLHEPVPDEHRRPAHREVDRPADRDGRDVHLVPRLSADGAGREPATCA